MGGALRSPLFLPMLTIELQQLEIYAYHGLFEEESVLGAYYELNISIQYNPSKKLIREISDTIDYTVVYEMLLKRMKQPTALLETIATEFSQQILAEFPIAESVFFSIQKKNPPIHSFVGNVAVTHRLNRKDL